jgi:hypothetical protein
MIALGIVDAAFAEQAGSSKCSGDSATPTPRSMIFALELTDEPAEVCSGRELGPFNPLRTVPICVAVDNSGPVGRGVIKESSSARREALAHRWLARRL